MNRDALCVLIIDDDPITLDSLTELLETEQFNLLTANDSAEGLLKIANGVRPNVVIIDVRRPYTTGVETIQRIRQFTGTDVPAILFTDDTSDEEIETAHLNHCNLLLKPKEINTLSKRINEVAA